MIAGSIQSNAKLTFEHCESTGKTKLVERSTGGLFHISKPYWDVSMLLTQLVNPTAGIFSGDRMQLEVKLEPSAKVSLVSPSATRFYSMQEKGAYLEQTIHLTDDSFLEFRSDYSIPQRDAIVEQINNIHLTKKARLLYIERFMPGRVAHGEAFRFQSFSSLTKIYLDHQLVVQERMDLLKENNGWPLCMPEWDQAYSANIWIAGVDTSELSSLFLKQHNDLFTQQNSTIFAGFSDIEPTIMVCRLISPTSIQLKQAILLLRQTISQCFPELSHSERIIHSNH